MALRTIAAVLVIGACTASNPSPNLALVDSSQMAGSATEQTQTCTSSQDFQVFTFPGVSAADIARRMYGYGRYQTPAQLSSMTWTYGTLDPGLIDDGRVEVQCGNILTAFGGFSTLTIGLR